MKSKYPRVVHCFRCNSLCKETSSGFYSCKPCAFVFGYGFSREKYDQIAADMAKFENPIDSILELAHISETMNEK